jgi:heme exporter protein D
MKKKQVRKQHNTSLVDNPNTKAVLLAIAVTFLLLLFVTWVRVMQQRYLYNPVAKKHLQQQNVAGATTESPVPQIYQER